MVALLPRIISISRSVAPARSLGCLRNHGPQAARSCVPRTGP